MEGATQHNKRIDSAIIKSGKKPYLLVFVADWMSHSAITKVVVGKLRAHYKEKIVVDMVDVDQYQYLTERYRISTCPTFLLFHDRSLVNKIEGHFSKKNTIELVDNYLQTK